MFSNLTSWWNKESSEGGEGKEEKEEKQEKEKDEEVEQQKVQENNTDWNKMAATWFQSVTEYATTLSENVKKQVKETKAPGFLDEFQKEQEKFARERQRLKDASVPPWIGYIEEEQLKAQILEISADSRNVLREPPPEVEFSFDYSKIAPVAMVMLKEDPRLQKLRFDLVPKKVSEEKFWKNYFYRVSLAKQSVQLSTLSSVNSQVSTEERPLQPLAAADNKEEKNSETINKTRTISEGDESVVDEFISDHPYNADSEHVNKESLKRELSQLGVEQKGGGTDDDIVMDESELWDELQAELKDLDLEDDTDEGLLVNWEQEMQDMMKDEQTT